MPEARRVIKEFYIYTATFTGLAAAGTDTFQIPVQADSDFLLEKLTYQADIAAAAQTDGTRVIPNVTCLITDTGSGRQLSDIAVPIPSYFGTGQVPFILPAPRKFKASSVIQVNVTNFDAAVTYNIRLAFIGHKVYGLAR